MICCQRDLGNVGLLEEDKYLAEVNLEEMASSSPINAQTHLRLVFGLTAPADAPTAEHPGLCLGYSFMK